MVIKTYKLIKQSLDIKKDFADLLDSLLKTGLFSIISDEGGAKLWFSQKDPEFNKSVEKLLQKYKEKKIDKKTLDLKIKKIGNNKSQFIEDDFIFSIDNNQNNNQFQSISVKVIIGIDSISVLREMASLHQFRILDLSTACFLPRYQEMKVIDQLAIDEKLNNVFIKFQLNPLFYLHKKSFYVKKNNNEAIYIINNSLLDYYYISGLEFSNTDELLYEVAPSLEKFVAYDDQELLPYSFYKYFNKNQNIINYSDFDIYNIDRKVFIKPFYFTYNKALQQYELFNSDQSVLNYADKIRNGERFIDSIKRIIRENLKQNSFFVKIKISKVEFDRDKENILTPRLIVSIYLDESIDNPEVIKKSLRNWQSIN